MYGGKIRRHGEIDDLLTEHDHATITVPALGEGDRLRIMDALDKAGLHDARFDQPRVKLEQFFLDIVAEAQKQGVMTAGAGNAGQIAGFLRGEEDDAKQREGRALIEGLTRDRLAGPAPNQAAEEKTTPTPKPRPQDDVLGELTGKTKPTTPTPTTRPAAETQPTPPKTREDRSVIDELLG